jgi:hypothetical protein
VIVIDVQRAGVKADETKTSLPTDDLLYIIFGQAITPFEEVAPRASVVFCLVFGHHPVVASTTVIGQAAFVGPVSPERGCLLDVPAFRAVLRSLRDLGPLPHLLAAFGHSLAITRLRTASEALFAILRETVGPTLVTPELRCVFF